MERWPANLGHLGGRFRHSLSKTEAIPANITFGWKAILDPKVLNFESGQLRETLLEASDTVGHLSGWHASKVSRFLAPFQYKNAVNVLKSLTQDMPQTTL